MYSQLFSLFRTERKSTERHKRSDGHGRTRSQDTPPKGAENSDSSCDRPSPSPATGGRIWIQKKILKKIFIIIPSLNDIENREHQESRTEIDLLWNQVSPADRTLGTKNVPHLMGIKKKSVRRRNNSIVQKCFKFIDIFDYFQLITLVVSLKLTLPVQTTF